MRRHTEPQHRPEAEPASRRGQCRHPVFPHRPNDLHPPPEQEEHSRIKDDLRVLGPQLEGQGARKQEAPHADGLRRVYAKASRTYGA